MTTLLEIIKYARDTRDQVERLIIQKAESLWARVPESAKKYVQAMFRNCIEAKPNAYPYRPIYLAQWIQKVIDDNGMNGTPGYGYLVEVRNRYDFTLEGTYGWKSEEEARAAISELAEAWKDDFEMRWGQPSYRASDNYDDYRKLEFDTKPEGWVFDCLFVYWDFKG